MKLADYKIIAKPMYAEIEAVTAKYGLTVGKLSAGVDEFAGTVRLTLNLTDANLTTKDGKPTTPEAERYKRLGSHLGLKPEWLGGTIQISGRKYTLQGMKDGRGAKCIVVKRDDDKTFIVTSTDFVKAAERGIEVRP